MDEFTKARRWMEERNMTWDIIQGETGSLVLITSTTGTKATGKNLLEALERYEPTWSDTKKWEQISGD